MISKKWCIIKVKKEDVKILETLGVWEINLLKCKDNTGHKIILVKDSNQDEDFRVEINNFKVAFKEEINFKEEISFKVVFKVISSFKEIILFKIKNNLTKVANNSVIKINLVEDLIVIGEDLIDISFIN